MTEAASRRRLASRREPIDPSGQHGLDRRRHLHGVDRSGQLMRPAFADERVGLDQRLDDLLQEEGVPLGPLDEERRESLEPGILAEERPEERVGALRR